MLDSCFLITPHDNEIRLLQHPKRAVERYCEHRSVDHMTGAHHGLEWKWQRHARVDVFMVLVRHHRIDVQAGAEQRDAT